MATMIRPTYQSHSVSVGRYVQGVIIIPPTLLI